jgi:hypothetical protein
MESTDDDDDRIHNLVRDAVFAVLASDGSPQLSVIDSYKLAEAIAMRVAELLHRSTP